jgi:cell division protein FtsQ
VARVRSNRRKPQRRALKWPQIRVNWRAVLMPPLVLAAVATAIFVGKDLLDRPVTRLIVEAPFQRVTSVQIESAISAALGSGFLSVDLDALTARIEAIDWVDEARVLRQWPDALVVRVSEHTAAARWGDSGLLNVRGELFTRDAHHGFPELPSLEGPPGTERRVAELYLAVRGRLAAAHLSLGRLTLDERGAVRFTLSTGQEIRIGRDDIPGRLDRFFEIATPALEGRFNDIEYVDLRYTNGFAVGWANRPTSGLATVESARSG